MTIAQRITIAWLLVLSANVASLEASDPDGSDEVLQTLAAANKDERGIAQIKEDNAFIRAAEVGDAEGVRQALKNGARVNSRYLDGNAFLSAGGSGYTALMRASLAGHEAVVRVLLDAMPDLELERKGKTSLYMAVMAGHDAVVDVLVKAGAKGEPHRIRLSHDLIRAACRGFKMGKGEGYPPYPGCVGDPAQAPEIAEILKRGADVNASDPGGFTPLMFAANLGLIENVKLLLAHGADPTLKSSSGESALSLADNPDSAVAREERRKVVELLKARLDGKK